MNLLRAVPPLTKKCTSDCNFLLKTDRFRLSQNDGFVICTPELDIPLQEYSVLIIGWQNMFHFQSPRNWFRRLQSGEKHLLIFNDYSSDIANCSFSTPTLAKTLV
jgi:hypothetical protein